jgi:molybdopterin biosynthesis enzyme
VVFGLPGNPVAVQVSCKIFIEPFLRKCFQRPAIQPVYLPLTDRQKKKTRLDEYFPCRLLNSKHSTGIQPCRMNGSGDIAALIGSDGIALHPAHQKELKENDHLAFYSWN